MSPISYFGRRFFDKELAQAGPSLTFKRLCTSRHVDDLQAIASVAICAILICFVILGCMARNIDIWKDQMLFVGGIVATATTALGWAYQAGSRRLGAVDLFASEISVICRVCLVVDFAESSVAGADRLGEAGCDTPVGRFTSQEHYTPAFDNHAGDLQALDFDVVTTVTRFYTYRMTMMDLMRRIAETGLTIESQRQMIYMQFLMYEAAREAVVKLIEFEPHQSEAVIGILCSEVVLFGFLQPSYENSFLGRRLDLRIDDYDAIVAEIREQVAIHAKEPHWLHARTTLPELIDRYEGMKTRIASSTPPQLAQAA